MQQKDVLMHVRELMTVPVEHNSLSFSKIKEGVRRPGLIEFSSPCGAGKTEATLIFLSEHPELQVAWLERSLEIYPRAFVDHRVSLSHVLFVEYLDSEINWVLRHIISSQIFDMIVISEPVFNETSLRRIQLLAEKCDCTVLCLNTTPTRTRAWPYTQQFEVERVQDQHKRLVIRSLKRHSRLDVFRDVPSLGGVS